MIVHSPLSEESESSVASPISYSATSSPVMSPPMSSPYNTDTTSALVCLNKNCFALSAIIRIRSNGKKSF